MQIKGCVNAFWLKIAMAVLMLMDHLYTFIPGCPLWFHYAARVVAPMFTFLVAEGMFYTSDRGKYIKRMYLAGAVMLAAMMALQLVFGTAPPNSIFMALAITASIIYCIDKARAKEKAFLWAVAAFFLLAASILFEGAFLCPVMGVIFYYCRKNKLLLCGVYLAATVLMMWGLGMLYDPQFWMVAGIIPILLYNGKRGLSNAFSKYFFYVFYPVHIWVLFVVQQIFFV
jgi:hypothetical protein